MSALEAYLIENDYIDKAYYLVQNEPQSQADYDVAAFLHRLARDAAPRLRLAISEEPKPQIAEHPDGAAGFDIWMAAIPEYLQSYAQERQRDFGEEVWVYSLTQSIAPYFNPIQRDASGIHTRILAWAAWSLRIRGWQWFDGSSLATDGRLGIRSELLREAFEDYEYLWLANGDSHPEVFQPSVVDPTVQSAALGLDAWTRDGEALMQLRNELGLFVEGTLTEPPRLLGRSPVARVRASYFINFQDSDGEPSENPLTVDGDTYIKVGWEPFSDAAGLGWYGSSIEHPSRAKFGFDDAEDASVVERSYVFDDFGRVNSFDFVIEPGRYEVTVGVGRPRLSSATPHNVVVQGLCIVDDVVLDSGTPTAEFSDQVDVYGDRLSVVLGGRSRSSGEFKFAFLRFLKIVPVD